MQSLAKDIRQHLIDSQFTLSMRDICQRIGITKRHMADMLAEDGLTFREIKAVAQEQVARELHGTMPQQDIARQMGFHGKHPHQCLWEFRRRNNLHELRVKDR